MFSKSIWHRGSKLVFAMGSILAIVQYFSQRSFWMDEAKLGLNIIEKSYGQLLEPLHSNQVAPILFLWIERFFGSLLGYNELAFRLFPLLCFLGMFWLYHKWIKKTNQGIHFVFFALSLLAFCQPLLYFASELKQYMVDVFVTIALIFAVYKTTRLSISKVIGLIILGALSISLSNVAVIMLFTTGLYLWYRLYRRNGQFINRALFPILVWTVVFVVYYFKFIADHPNRALMLPYWEYAFMPTNPFTKEFWLWCFDRYEMLFSGIMGVNKKIPFLYHLFGIAYVFGVFAFAKAKNYSILFLTVLPLLLHLILSALHLYPFERRMGLYLQPLSALMCAKGFVFVLETIKKRVQLKWLDFAILGPGLILLAITLYTFPKKREEFMQSYTSMSEAIQPEDLILRGTGADNAWELYRQAGVITIPNEILQIGYHPDDFSKHHQQLDSLKGRVWFFIASDRRDPKTGVFESAYVVDYLKQRGELVHSFETIGSAVYAIQLR